MVTVYEATTGPEDRGGPLESIETAPCYVRAYVALIVHSKAIYGPVYVRVYVTGRARWSPRPWWASDCGDPRHEQAPHHMTSEYRRTYARTSNFWPVSNILLSHARTSIRSRQSVLACAPEAMATSRTRKSSATRDADKNRPLVIATMNEKGGAGKTTISVLIAAVLAEKQRVLLADLDEQGTAHAWSTWAQYPGSLTVERVGHRVEDALAAAAGSHDVAILDCPPGYSDRSMAAVIAADIVIVPVLPSQFDATATARTVEVLTKADNEFRREPVKRLFVANRIAARTKASKALVDALAELAGGPERVATISQKTIYVEAVAGRWSKLPASARSEIDQVISKLTKLVAP